MAFAAFFVIGGGLFFHIPKSLAAGGDDPTWTTSAHTLPTAILFETGTQLGNKIYDVGLSVQTGTESVYIGTIGSDGDVTWITSANTPPNTNMLLFPIGAFSGNKIYFMGGQGQAGLSDTVYIGTIGSDGDVTWITSANTLPAAMTAATSAVSSNRIYVMGGSTGNGPSDTVYIGTIGDDGDVTWTTSANTLPAATMLSTSAVSGNKIYVMGGEDSQGNIKDTVYIGTIGGDGDVTWTSSANTLPTAMDGATSVLSGNKIYVMGGSTGSIPLDSVYIGTIGNDGDVTWTTSANVMPVTSVEATSAVSGNKIYVMGGMTGVDFSDFTDAVYIGTLPQAAAPTISSIAPTSGPTVGGTEFSILGNNFQSGATVTIGGATATDVNVTDANTITATTPAGSAGTADVVVTNPDSQSATLTGGFTYSEPAPSATVTDPTPEKITAQVTGGNITVPGSDPTDTTSFTTNVDLTLQTGDASVTFLADTVVTETGGGNLNLTQLTTINNTTIIQAQLDDVLGAIKIGISDLHLTFSQPVTVTIPVGSSHNGQTLQVVFQEDGTTTWTPETTCTVSNGNCVFQTDHATTFAAEDIEVAPAAKVYTKAKISSWEASIYTDQSSCPQRLKLTIEGKHFKKNAIVRINGQKASSIKLKNSENLSASFCLAKLTDNQVGSKRSVYVTNPHTAVVKAEKKIDLDSVINSTDNVSTANLDPTNTDGVKNIQQVLVELGYLDKQNITGTYGPLTTAAVKKFQADNGLPTTGTVRPLTKAKLGEKG